MLTLPKGGDKLTMDARVALKDQVFTHLPWLFDELGFRMVEDRYDPKDFGNALVILESAELRIRIVRDRGQIFTDVASLLEPDRWLPLKDAHEVMTRRDGDPVFDLQAVEAILRMTSAWRGRATTTESPSVSAVPSTSKCTAVPDTNS